MTDPDRCPHCAASLIGNPIPQMSIDAGYYGTATHWRREIGHNIRGVYDGVLYWSCPDCGLAWPRWTDGEGRLTQASTLHADRHNTHIRGSKDDVA